jgi:hypothetical protein
MSDINKPGLEHIANQIMLLGPNVVEQRQANPPVVVEAGDVDTIGAHRKEAVVGNLQLAVNEGA